MTESTDLIISQPLNASVVFAPGGVEKVLAEIEAKARAFKGDISTKTGRDEVKSFAYKITRSKTALDELGKDFVADIKKRAGEIDAERRTIREKLDDLKDEVRKPLTEYEAAIAAHEAELVKIIEMANCEGAVAVIEHRITALGNWPKRDWGEFDGRAAEAMVTTYGKLNDMLAAAQKREAEAAELETLRREKAEREQRERDETIALVAAAKARVEADAQRMRDKTAAETREAQAKADAEALALKVEADKKAAIEKAERDAAAAVEAERKRVAAEQAAADAERKRREDDKAHRKTINTAILAALVKAGLSTEDGMCVIVAIVKREIPHTVIEY